MKLKKKHIKETHFRYQKQYIYFVSVHFMREPETGKVRFVASKGDLKWKNEKASFN